MSTKSAKLTGICPFLVTLIPGKTLIFLDEIQNCGNARTAIKFLAKDGDKEVEDPESVPTGYEDFVTMYSLDFEEFLWAEGYGEDAIAVLKSYFEKMRSSPCFIK